MRTALLAALVTSFGCTVVNAVSAGVTLPKERALECKAHCEAIDMKLAALVLIMNHAGCVCEPRAASASLSGGAAAAAGGATIAALEDEQRRQQQQRPAGQQAGAPPYTPPPPPPPMRR